MLQLIAWKPGAWRQNAWSNGSWRAYQLDVPQGGLPPNQVRDIKLKEEDELIVLLVSILVGEGAI